MQKQAHDACGIAQTTAQQNEGVDGFDRRKETNIAARSLKPNTHVCAFFENVEWRANIN